jgi:hypothetical protein
VLPERKDQKKKRVTSNLKTRSEQKGITSNLRETKLITTISYIEDKYVYVSYAPEFNAKP